MALQMKRIVLFTPNMPAMTAFYRDVIGLKVKSEEKGWVELDAGGCAIALHSGTSAVGKRAPKIVFYAKDVGAVRDELVFARREAGQGQDLAGLA